ncbi:MAG: hypothetical protein VYE68_09925 [Acidobacteriota bacterium]|nr:hypothetical protein [Acidobacteriota bacterium]
MTTRFLAHHAAVLSLVVFASTQVAAQSLSTAGQGESGPRTPWGDPDLQGTWTNSTTTPMERPDDLADREILTEEEWAVRNPGSGISAFELSSSMPTGAYNDFWLEKGELSLRTSLIVDPPNGKYPPLTPEAVRRRGELRTSFRQSGFDSWTDLSMYDRCLTRGMPGAMSPGFYNHNYQILQTPDHVAIVVEMIHDARIIPLDGRTHVSPAVGQWLGDSRGRWEGDTLVVETRNLPASGRVVEERFTRVDADTIDYRITVTDPDEWAAPWTALMPMSPTGGPLFEYACHEGNHSVPNMLAGSRAEEAQ